MLDGIEGLDGNHLLHAARADLLSRLGRTDEAAESYRRALGLVGTDAERRFLQKKLVSLPLPSCTKVGGGDEETGISRR
jgi:RNA polymerase sigma-70 factor (ECF subfamily)